MCERKLTFFIRNLENQPSVNLTLIRFVRSEKHESYKCLKYVCVPIPVPVSVSVSECVCVCRLSLSLSFYLCTFGNLFDHHLSGSYYILYSSWIVINNIEDGDGSVDPCFLIRTKADAIVPWEYLPLYPTCKELLIILSMYVCTKFKKAKTERMKFEKFIIHLKC